MHPSIRPCALALLVLASAACSKAEIGDPPAPPVALVYRGPAGCEGCSEPLAGLLQSSRYGFAVTYVGPYDVPLTEDLLDGAAVYAQPGGGQSVEDAFADVMEDTDMIRSFVARGGRYLGFCMGGYLADRSPGFDLLPGASGGFIDSQGASVTTPDDTTVQVLWRGVPHTLFFQDGPYFTLDTPGAATVLATYASNGAIAALVAPFGNGKVGVVGPHPEAPRQWFMEIGIDDPENGYGIVLGHDLVETTMAP